MKNEEEKIDMNNDIYLSVIIPCKNQEGPLKKTLSDIIEISKDLDFDVEIVYVDGDSSDNSEKVAESFKDKAQHMQIMHESELNLGKHYTGKGAAVKIGMSRAKGEMKMFMDADSSTPFKEIYKLLPYFEKDYDIIMGSRYTDKPLPASNHFFKSFWSALKEVFEVLIYGYSKSNTMEKKQPRIRQLISRGGNLAFVVLLGQSFADTRCGFKVYNNKASDILFPLQTLPGFGFDTEILVIARKYDLKAIEVPISWTDDAEDTNVTMGDALKSFLEIFKIKWYKFSGKYSKRK